MSESQEVRRVDLWWDHCKFANRRDGERDKEHKLVFFFPTSYIPRRLKSREE